MILSFFLWQGSEIFTVSAKDGDVGNPNPVSYSFEEGEPSQQTFAGELAATWVRINKNK